MADATKPGSAQDGRRQPGSEPEPDHAAPGEDPPTGGLTAVLGKLRDAAEAHDGELSHPGGLPQLS